MKHSNLKKRIIAFALATISVTSVATATVPMVSAAETTQDAVIEQIDISGKDIYDRAQQELINIASQTFKDLPGGRYFVEFYQYCLTLIGRTLEENEPPAGPSLEDIKKELDDIKKQIVEISADLKLMKNKNFDDVIDEISWLCDEHYPKIEALITAKCALLEAEQSGDQSLIAEKKEYFDLAVEDVKNIPYGEIKAKLQKAMQYITERSISCPNPFMNFYEAKKSSYKYGKEAIEETYKQYDEKVWMIFYAGLSIYDTAVQVNIDALYQDPATEAEGDKLAKELAQFLGNGTDTDVNSVAYATKYYQNVIDKKNEYVNEYTYDTGKSVQFGDLAMGKISMSGFFAVGDKRNLDLVRYIGNSQSYQGSAEWQEYFSAIEHLITNEYMSGDNHKMTLRHFLEEKFSIKVPENCDYLVCGQNYYVCYNVEGGVSLDGKIPLIKLDESRATIETVVYANGVKGDLNYKNITIEGLCYFVPEADTVSEKVAEVIYKEQTIEFDSFEAAWEYANECDGCVLKLYADWVAQKKGDDNFTSFGDSAHFMRVDDKNTYYGALYVRNDFTVDLNGHTIDRNQDTPVPDGSVFILDSLRPHFSIIDTSGKKGKITGGNTTGRGGAINDLTSGVFNESSVILENICITGNHAVEEGGGIAYSCCSDSDGLIIKNCDITNNSSDKTGGGVFAEVSGMYTADVTLDGIVNVTGNTANGKPNNFTLDENFFVKSVIKFKTTFNQNSRIGVNTTASADSIDFTEGNSNIKHYEYVFTSDSTNHRINIYKGTFSSKYYGELEKI